MGGQLHSTHLLAHVSLHEVIACMHVRSLCRRTAPSIRVLTKKDLLQAPQWSHLCSPPLPIPHPPPPSDENLRQTICGTPLYLAPEMVQGKDYTSKVDIWSAGVLLYILMSGTVPFIDENQQQLFRKIAEAKYVLEGDDWDHVSDDAKLMIRNIMHKDPHQRLSGALRAPTPLQMPQGSRAAPACKHPSWIKNALECGAARAIHLTAM